MLLTKALVCFVPLRQSRKEPPTMYNLTLHFVVSAYSTLPASRNDKRAVNKGKSKKLAGADPKPTTTGFEPVHVNVIDF
jgi:hypothetical protein